MFGNEKIAATEKFIDQVIATVDMTSDLYSSTCFYFIMQISNILLQVAFIVVVGALLPKIVTISK